MGNCLCCVTETEEIRVALKLPNGLTGLNYNQSSKSFVPIDNIDIWIKSLYLDSSWTGWIVYNDETAHIDIKGTTKGHCKGILAWNKEHISWLIHSVPNFPRLFTGNTISDIEKGEHIFGQSFCYTKLSYTDKLLHDIVNHIAIMEAHMYILQVDVQIPKATKTQTVQSITFSDKISHHVKSPYAHIDIYSEYLCGKDQAVWNVETWKRGSKITKACKNIQDIETLKFAGNEYKESQDHSKWAISEELCFIGDLNRMESQSKRGGGGILIRDPDMAGAFRKLIHEVIIKF